MRASSARCALSVAAMLLKSAMRRLSSSDVSATSRTSSLPAAICRVARERRATGSDTRLATEAPRPGGEEDDEDRADEHATIELVDLPFDLRAGASASGTLSTAVAARRRAWVRRRPGTGTAQRCLRRQRSAAGSARWRDRPAAGVRVGSSPETNRSRWLVAISIGALEQVHVLMERPVRPRPCTSSLSIASRDAARS